jgi:hypothetical protein
MWRHLLVTLGSKRDKKWMPAPSVDNFWNYIFKISKCFDKIRDALIRENFEWRHTKISVKKASRILSKHHEILKIEFHKLSIDVAGIHFAMHVVFEVANRWRNDLLLYRVLSSSSTNAATYTAITNSTTNRHDIALTSPSFNTHYHPSALFSKFPIISHYITCP